MANTTFLGLQRANLTLKCSRTNYWYATPIGALHGALKKLDFTMLLLVLVENHTRHDFLYTYMEDALQVHSSKVFCFKAAL